MKKNSCKFLTLNINSINARIESFSNCIKMHDPDVVMLQEIKCENHKFPDSKISDLGYHYSVIHGQKSYNGVAILSKFEMTDTVLHFNGNTFSDDSRYIETTIKTNLGKVRVICVYCPNGSPVESDKYYRKLDFFSGLKDRLSELLKTEKNLLIAGDINIAPYDDDVYSPAELQNSVAFTIKERLKLREILGLGFIDCYRILNEQKEFSWFDYRGGSLQKRTGFRIDLILANNNLANLLNSSSIDLKTREGSRELEDLGEKPSDHCPVIADFRI